MQFKLLEQDFKEFLSVVFSENDRNKLCTKLHGDLDPQQDNLEHWDDLAVSDLVLELNTSAKNVFYKPLVSKNNTIQGSLAHGVVSSKIKKFICENGIK